MVIACIFALVLMAGIGDAHSESDSASTGAKITVENIWGDGPIEDQDFFKLIIHLLRAGIIGMPVADPETGEQRLIIRYHVEEPEGFSDETYEDLMTDVKYVTNNSLMQAIQTWKELNPNLSFIKYTDAFDYLQDVPGIYLKIKWHKYETVDESGSAGCITFDGVINDCVLHIRLGNEDCNGNYILQDVDYATNTIMHEIGHALGLGHISDQSHLMYGEADPVPEDQLDTLGYEIPMRLDTFYIGEKVLHEQIDKLAVEIEPLKEKIDLLTWKIEPLKEKIDLLTEKIEPLTKEMEQLEEKKIKQKRKYDEISNQYLPYKGKTLDQREYDKAVNLYDELVIEEDRFNALIVEWNALIDDQHVLIYEQTSLVERHNLLFDEQTLLVERANLLIDEQNVLGEKTNCYSNLEE